MKMINEKKEKEKKQNLLNYYVLSFNKIKSIETNNYNKKNQQDTTHLCKKYFQTH